MKGVPEFCFVNLFIIILIIISTYITALGTSGSIKISPQLGI